MNKSAIIGSAEESDSGVGEDRRVDGPVGADFLGAMLMMWSLERSFFLKEM